MDFNYKHQRRGGLPHYLDRGPPNPNPVRMGRAADAN